MASKKLVVLSQKIAQIEGFNKRGTLAQRNNNPGNLRYVGQKGAVKGDKGFAKFKTPDAGWQALQQQIALDASRGHTLQSFVYKYAPPSENNSAIYLQMIMKSIVAKPQQPLSDIIK